MPETTKPSTDHEKTATAPAAHEDHMDRAKHTIKDAVEKVVDKLPGRDHAAH